MDIDQILEKLWKCTLPTSEEFDFLISRSIEVLSKEPNVLNIRSPITVCGDIHGQFYDLLELFSIGGQPPEQNFLFLGDYVDRGFYGTETFLLLITLKIRFPTKIYLLRGNHECEEISTEYGFYDEIVNKFKGVDSYSKCLSVFNMLPLSAIIDGKIFCVHGGLSPDLHQIQEIDEIDRNSEPPKEGVFLDLLWSDPDFVKGFAQSQRGAGYIFGGDVTKQFIHENGINYILRAHQFAEEGYQMWFDGLLYTVWSAPNYCYRSGNKASIYEISSLSKARFKTFKEAPIYARGNIPVSKIPQYFS